MVYFKPVRDDAGPEVTATQSTPGHPLFTDIFTHFFIFHDLISTTSTSLTFPFPGYSTLVFFYLEFYNKEVASSGRSAVSPVSEVSGLTLIIPGTRSGWR